MLVQQLPKANERWNTIYSNLKFRSKTRDLEHCVLVTLHRPSNVDEVEKLRKIMQALVDIAQEVPVIFPVHPRTRSRMENAGEKIEPLKAGEEIAIPPRQKYTLDRDDKTSMKKASYRQKQKVYGKKNTRKRIKNEIYKQNRQTEYNNYRKI